MFKQADQKYLQAMNYMKLLMITPDEMKEWFGSKKKEFDAFSDDK